jgi:hypothetical protein
MRQETKGICLKNAEYDAKEAQGMLEMRITNLKKFTLMQDLLTSQI